MPAYFKHDIVQPLLKRCNLDSTELSNFRPISKLHFLSKILDKVVFIQLQKFLGKNCTLQSALLKVHNYVLLTLDSGASAILVLLNHSVAFDTKDNNILFSRLEHHAGV